MTKAELQTILEKHAGWLRGAGGQPADLRSANLRYADLRSANLSYANLSYADLICADLRSADLSSANLRSANLSSADLSSANLRSANLSYADLRYANLDEEMIFAWESHDLISEILKRAAGEDVDKLKVAGLILVSREKCWNDFLSLDDPLTEWALDTLTPYAKDDRAPKVLRDRRTGEVAA